ncbi:hypothetical protein GCM10009531_69160 [Actinoplanes capillaceus]
METVNGPIMSRPNAAVTTAALSRKIRQNSDNRCVSSTIAPILDCLPAQRPRSGRETSIRAATHPPRGRRRRNGCWPAPGMEVGPDGRRETARLGWRSCRNEWEVAL